MIDPLSFFFDFIAICFLLFVILVGVSFLYRIFNIKLSEPTHSYDSKDNDNEIEKDSKEDSNGDGLVLFDDPLFPEEFDDDC